MKKLRCACTVEYNAATVKEILPFATTCTNLEGIVQNKVRQSKIDTG